MFRSFLISVISSAFLKVHISIPKFEYFVLIISKSPVTFITILLAFHSWKVPVFVVRLKVFLLTFCLKRSLVPTIYQIFRFYVDNFFLPDFL